MTKNTITINQHVIINFFRDTAFEYTQDIPQRCLLFKPSISKPRKRVLPLPQYDESAVLEDIMDIEDEIADETADEVVDEGYVGKTVSVVE